LKVEIRIKQGIRNRSEMFIKAASLDHSQEVGIILALCEGCFQECNYVAVFCVEFELRTLCLLLLGWCSSTGRFVFLM
jgi:hypothetical protein